MGFKTFENAMASHPARQNISEKPIVFLAKQPTNWKTGELWSLNLNNTTSNDFRVKYLHLFYLCNLLLATHYRTYHCSNCQYWTKKWVLQYNQKMFRKSYKKCIRQAKDSLQSNATKWILHKTRYNISLHFESWNSDFYMKIRSVSPSHIVLTTN